MITGITGFLAGYLNKHFILQGNKVYGIAQSPLKEEISGVLTHN